MSALPLSKIVRFLLVTAGLIIVFSVIWTFVDSAYSGFLGRIASGLVPADFKVEERDGTIYFTRKYVIMEVQGRPVEVALPENYPAENTIVASAIQFGLLLTVALVAATPGLTWRRRLIFSGIAAAAAFALQVLSVVIMAKTFNSLFFVIVSDVFPPLIWAYCAFRYWLAPRRGIAKSESAPVRAKKDAGS